MKRTAYPLTSVIIHMDVMVKYQAFYMCMFFFQEALRVILQDDKGGIFIGHTCPIFSKTQKSFLKENLLKLLTTIGKNNHDYMTNF